MRKFLQKLIDLFFPPRCVFCSELVSRSDTVCSRCKAMLPYTRENFCPVCGNSLGRCCCLTSEWNYESAVAPFFYEGMLREGLLDFKFHGKTKYNNYFCDKIVEELRHYYPNREYDCVTYVPMTKASQIERGYNQAKLLAEGISERLRVPLLSGLILKKRDGALQHGLGLEERWINAQRSFVANEERNITGKRVLLIDDIKTTGATLNQCAKLLKELGAAQVHCATVSCTIEKRDSIEGNGKTDEQL